METFIKRVSIRNFKSIASVDVELKPLTVVIGRNSAGKSSLIQSIRLAAQHLSNDFASDHRMSLNRDNVELGSFSEVLNRRCPPDDVIYLAIETNSTSWSAEIGRDIDRDGAVRDRSREAVVKTLAIREHQSGVRVADSFELNFTFEELWERDIPLLFPRAQAGTGRVTIARGKGQILVHPLSQEDPISRQFDLALFVPLSQRRYHPVPIETVDFFHFLVEQFYYTCVQRSARSTQPRFAAGLVANKKSIDDSEERWADRRGDFFEFLIADNDSNLSDTVSGPLSSGRIDALDGLISKMTDRARQRRLGPVRNMADFLGVHSGQGPASYSVARASWDALAKSVITGGVSELKSILIPRLQASFGRYSLNILKATTLAESTPDDENNDEFANDSEMALLSALSSTRERLTRAAKSVYYLGPIRDVDLKAPQLQDPRSLGSKGEQSVEVLAHEAYTKNSFPDPDDLGETITDEDFSSNLERWLKFFRIAHGVEPLDRGRDRPTIGVVIDDAGNKVDLRSVGQGLSQVLPVLMQCLLAPPDGSIVLIEQPELHLHPRLESQLADFFLACIRAGRQILIETHSEHLINHLRLRIAQDESDATRDAVQILFAEQHDGSTVFRSGEVDTYGGLTNDWPEEFLDLDVEANEKLIRAALAKRLAELEQDDDFDDDDEDL